MGKGKLAKFAEMETFNNVFQYPYSVIYNISGLTGFDSGMKWYVSMRSLDG